MNVNLHLQRTHYSDVGSHRCDCLHLKSIRRKVFPIKGCSTTSIQFRGDLPALFPNKLELKSPAKVKTSLMPKLQANVICKLGWW